MKKNDLKISHFDLSKHFELFELVCKTGTLVYKAPEIWNGASSSFKSDIW